MLEWKKNSYGFDRIIGSDFSISAWMLYLGVPFLFFVKKPTAPRHLVQGCF